MSHVLSLLENDWWELVAILYLPKVEYPSSEKQFIKTWYKIQTIVCIASEGSNQVPVIKLNEGLLEGFAILDLPVN